MSASVPHPNLLDLAAQIVSAHATRNALGVEELPDIIRSVYAALREAAAEASSPEKPQPFVPANKSVFPDYIVCLEDGRKLKSLKRHLNTAFGMTPDDYRRRWGLPKTYPMVAPNYAATRSTLAKRLGLGRKTVTPAKEPSAPPIQRIPEGKRGRKAPRKANVPHQVAAKVES